MSRIAFRSQLTVTSDDVGDDDDKRVRPVPTGKVKWYDAEKGFGFLSQEDGEDVYVRSSALPEGIEGLKAGQKVEFGLASGRRGPQALSVKLIDPAR